jgi:hypothetical protein
MAECVGPTTVSQGSGSMFDHGLSLPGLKESWIFSGILSDFP